MTAADACSVRDRGTALFSTAIGVLVFLMFLLFAVQLLFSLFANSTVTAITNDAVQRAALQPDQVEAIEAEARLGLGDVGDAAEFTWSQDDADGDGEIDTVVLAVVAHPPRFIPPSIGDSIGVTEIAHTARARIEAFG